MFTGIVTHIGTVRHVVLGGVTRFEIQSDFPLQSIDIGASVSHSGVCLTVTEKRDGIHFVEASTETLSRTTLGSWDVGTPINLERSLRLGDELGGHLVFGHVDAVAEMTACEADGDSWRLTLAIPSDLTKFVAEKGSVCLDGVSLTVNWVKGNHFGVNIIPHTWACTTLKNSKPGLRVNFEIDMLARYVARMMPTFPEAT